MGTRLLINIWPLATYGHSNYKLFMLRVLIYDWEAFLILATGQKLSWLTNQLALTGEKHSLLLNLTGAKIS